MYCKNVDAEHATLKLLSLKTAVTWDFERSEAIERKKMMGQLLNWKGEHIVILAIFCHKRMISERSEIFNLRVFATCLRFSCKQALWSRLNVFIAAPRAKFRLSYILYLTFPPSVLHIQWMLILTIKIQFKWQNEWFAGHLVLPSPSSWLFNWIARIKCMPIIDCFSLGVFKMTECTHTAAHIDIPYEYSYFLFHQICLFLVCIWLVWVRVACVSLMLCARVRDFASLRRTLIQISTFVATKRIVNAHAVTVLIFFSQFTDFFEMNLLMLKIAFTWGKTHCQLNSKVKWNTND